MVRPPVANTPSVQLVRAVCNARCWIGTDVAQDLILAHRRVGPAYSRSNVVFLTHRNVYRLATRRSGNVLVPIWYRNHFTVLRRDGGGTRLFDPYHRRRGRFAAAPMELVRRIFPDAQYVALLPQALQTESADTFCVMWGVWFMSGRFERTARLADLFAWLAGLLATKVLRDDFVAYMTDDLDIPRATARRYADLVRGVSAAAYVRALERTPLHLDDPDAPCNPITSARRARNRILSRLAAHRHRTAWRYAPVGGCYSTSSSITRIGFVDSGATT